MERASLFACVQPRSRNQVATAPTTKCACPSMCMPPRRELQRRHSPGPCPDKVRVRAHPTLTPHTSFLPTVYFAGRMAPASTARPTAWSMWPTSATTASRYAPLHASSGGELRVRAGANVRLDMSCTGICSSHSMKVFHDVMGMVASRMCVRVCPWSSKVRVLTRGRPLHVCVCVCV